jgi:hypothetical protein
MVELDDVPWLQRELGQQADADFVQVDQRAGAVQSHGLSTSEISVNNGELDFTRMILI